LAARALVTLTNTSARAGTTHRRVRGTPKWYEPFPGQQKNTQENRRETLENRESVDRLAGTPLPWVSVIEAPVPVEAASSPQLPITDALTSRERFLMAALYGGGAALLGALIWFAITKLTGYELGLVAVVVGLLVGKAVRKGSRGVGGRRFQILAVVLTYLSIGLAYVPLAIGELDKGASGSAKGGLESGTSAAPAPAPEDAAKAPPSVGAAVGLLLGGCLVLMVVLPALGAVKSIGGALILGIALWEAWRMNRVAPPAPAAATAGPPPVDPPAPLAGPPATV